MEGAAGQEERGDPGPHGRGGVAQTGEFESQNVSGIEQERIKLKRPLLVLPSVCLIDRINVSK